MKITAAVIGKILVILSITHFCANFFDPVESCSNELLDFINPIHWLYLKYSTFDSTGLPIMALGIILIVCSGYRSKTVDEIQNVKFKDMLPGYAVKYYLCTLKYVAYLGLIVLFIIGLYYAFFTKYAPIIWAIVIPVILLGIGVVFGFSYVSRYDEKHKKGEDN